MKRIFKSTSGMNDQRGFSLLEAMVASFIMLIGIGGLMALFVIAAAKNAGQGDQATRTTEYAQDKMEQLMALNFNDSTTLGVGSASTANGCTGCGLAGPGSVTSAVTNYVDYVNPTNATPITASSTGALYVREWSVATTSTNVKVITVYVKALFSTDAVQSLAPSTTLISVKEKY